MASYADAADFAGNVEDISRTVEYLQILAAGTVDRTRNQAITVAATARTKSGRGWITGWDNGTETLNETDATWPAGAAGPSRPVGSAGSAGSVGSDAGAPPAVTVFASPADDGCANTAEFLRLRLRIGKSEAHHHIHLRARQWKHKGQHSRRLRWRHRPGHVGGPGTRHRAGPAHPVPKNNSTASSAPSKQRSPPTPCPPPAETAPRSSPPSTTRLLSQHHSTGIEEPKNGTGNYTFTGPIAAATLRKLACDADIIPALLGTHGEILDLGRKTRLFTPAQRLALTARDQGCTFPNCTIPAPWCEAHHITYWSHNGPTNLNNGALLCSHHHLIHKEQWTITARNGVPWFTPPPHIDPTQEPQQNRYFKPPPPPQAG